MAKHKGGCHCRAVQFEFDAPEEVRVTHCDCSVCNMTGFEHVFIPQEDVRFLSGKDKLTVYTFGTHAAKHMFCPVCGIKPLYIPRSHPECYSVNLRCVEAGTLSVGKTIEFNGQNWDENIEALREESR